MQVALGQLKGVDGPGFSRLRRVAAGSSSPPPPSAGVPVGYWQSHPLKAEPVRYRGDTGWGQNLFDSAPFVKTACLFRRDKIYLLVLFCAGVLYPFIFSANQTIYFFYRLINLLTSSVIQNFLFFLRCAATRPLENSTAIAYTVTITGRFCHFSFCTRAKPEQEVLWLSNPDPAKTSPSSV